MDITELYYYAQYPGMPSQGPVPLDILLMMYNKEQLNASTIVQKQGETHSLYLGHLVQCWNEEILLHENASQSDSGYWDNVLLGLNIQNGIVNFLGSIFLIIAIVLIYSCIASPTGKVFRPENMTDQEIKKLIEKRETNWGNFKNKLSEIYEED